MTVFFCLSLLWIVFIWGNSLQRGVVSGAMSGTVTERINAFFGQFMDGFYISGLLVRKIAHFLEFAFLAFLLCFDYCFILGINKDSSLKRISALWLALPTAVAVACIDESIQLFVEDRVGSISDVLIDSSGALICTLVFYLVLILRKRQRK